MNGSYYDGMSPQGRRIMERAEEIRMQRARTMAGLERSCTRTAMGRRIADQCNQTVKRLYDGMSPQGRRIMERAEEIRTQRARTMAGLERSCTRAAMGRRIADRCNQAVKRLEELGRRRGACR